MGDKIGDIVLVGEIEGPIAAVAHHYSSDMVSGGSSMKSFVGFLRLVVVL